MRGTMMTRQLTTVLGTAILLAMATGPALAGVRLPEPASMTLFGVGVAGAYLAKRLIGRK
jgi:PEP-CTERM motif